MSELRSAEAIRSKAPLRISFAGGATDMPSYYLEHGGAVLSTTIDRYSFVDLRMRSDALVNIESLDFNVTVNYHLDERPVFDGVLDLAKAAVRRLANGRATGGLDLCLQSDAPAGSGLGGSASLTVALLAALAAYTGRRFDNYELAELANDIERVDLGINGGKQDQYAATFGGFNLIEFSRSGVVVNPLRMPPAILNDLEYHLLLCYTGRIHLSADLIDRQEQLYRQGRAETVDGLRALRQLSYEMKDALLRGRLTEFGELLDVAWQRKILVNPEVTNEFIDEMYRVARDTGAVGGKLLGTGGGGYLLFFVEGRKKRLVRERLTMLGGQVMDFSFVEDGVQVWTSCEA